MKNRILKNILIIEDNPGDSFYTKHILKEAEIGEFFTIIEDGEEAWEYLENCSKGLSNKKPDLIILDIHLPKISGLDLLKDLRQLPALSDTPIIILTVSKETKDFISSMVNGAEYYTVKPISKNEILKITNSIYSLNNKSLK
ncbi:MAG: response regulator [Chitinophagaceae bacterium]|nr:MAG: response regulator [Chitinophagaceae bacterium]